MRERTTMRARVKSWRTAAAIAGVAAMTVTLGQSVSTLATPNAAVSTTGSQVATGNFFPTPLTANVRCETNAPWYDLVTGKRADVSWDAVPGATGYLLELVSVDTGVVWSSEELPASTRSKTRITDSEKQRIYARVRTVNGPAVSSGYRSQSGTIVARWLTDRTECESQASPGSSGNQGWEDTTVWNPALPAPASAGRQSVMEAQRSAPAADVDQAEVDRAEAIAEAEEQEPSETSAPSVNEPSDVMPSSSTTSTTVRPPATSRPSSTTAPSPSATTQASTRATSTTTQTPTRTSSIPPVTVTTTTKPPTSPVRLPGGGEAKLVDETTLVVSGTEAPQCSVTVRAGSRLELRDGALEVTDAVEARVVDLETCELSEK